MESVNKAVIRNASEAFFRAVPFPARFPPIPIKEAILNLSVEFPDHRIRFLIAEADIGNVDGSAVPKIVKDHIVYCIVVSSSVPEVRKRWTFAHELAHVLLGHPFKSDKSPWAMDREANKLARELLIPRSCILANYKDEIRFYRLFNRSYGERYGVSDEAIQLALREYGLEGSPTGLCPYYENLECLSENPCVEPPPECQERAVEDDSYTVNLKCKPFVVEGHLAYTFFHIETVDDLVRLEPLGDLIEANSKKN